MEKLPAGADALVVISANGGGYQLIYSLGAATEISAISAELAKELISSGTKHLDLSENFKRMGLAQTGLGGSMPGLPFGQVLGDQQGNQLDAIKALLGGNTGNPDVTKLFGSLNGNTASPQSLDIGELLGKLGINKTGLF